MNCIEAVKRGLIKLGLLPSFTQRDVSDAQTEDLVVERQRVLNEFVETTEKFKDKSDKLVADVGRGKTDLESVLDHLKQVSVATADARTLIEGMMARRQKREMR